MRKLVFVAAALCSPAFLPTEASATAALCTSTSSLAFGNVLVGTTSGKDIVAQNCGSGTAQPKNLVPTFGGATGAGFGATTAYTPPGSTPQGQSASHTYTFAPTARGASTGSVTLGGTATGGSQTRTLSSLTIGLSGKGVAPVNEVSSNDAGLTRLGTTGAGTVTVKNTGDGNLAGAGIGNLTGTVGAGSGAFAGPGGAVTLGDGGSVTFSYNYTPTSHGSADSAAISYAFTDGSSDGKNLAQSGSATVHGSGVGPVFATDIGPDGLDFGTITGGTSTSLTFHIMNTTTDAGGDSLTGLTIEGAQIGGTWADLFTLDPFAPVVVKKGGEIELTLHYDAPLSPGFFQDTTLTFLTDQGAAFGGTGQQFVFSLSGGTLTPEVVLLSRVDVPEPATGLLLAGGLAGLGWARRRRPVR